MSGLENIGYYRRRRRQEIAAAAAAAHPEAKRIHEELAACYAARAGFIADVEEELPTGLATA